MLLPTQMRSSYQKNTPKKSSYEVLTKRVFEFITAIKVAKEISDYELQGVLGWGPGVFERISRIVKHDYSNEVEWNKKQRVWSYMLIVEEIKVND